MFKGIKNNWKKAEAAALIQTIFEEAPDLVERDQAAKLANALVEKAWTGFPHYFDGSLGPRPNKATIAAFTLAITLDHAPKDGRIYPAVLVALGKLMTGLEANSFLLDLAKIDEKLLSIAEKVLTDHLPPTAEGSQLDDELSEMMAKKG